MKPIIIEVDKDDEDISMKFSKDNKEIVQCPKLTQFFEKNQQLSIQVIDLRASYDELNINYPVPLIETEISD